MMRHEALIKEAEHAIAYPDVRPISYRLVERLVDALDDDLIEVEGQLTNLSELLSMKDPKDYTVVETSLSKFIDYYFSEAAK